MRSTIQRAVCSSCHTLFAAPDSVGGGLGRARVVSRRNVLFSLFSQIIVPIASVYSYHAYSYQVHISLSVNLEETGWLDEADSSLSLCTFQVDFSNPANPFLSCAIILTFIFAWHHAWFHNRVALGCLLYTSPSPRD